MQKIRGRKQDKARQKTDKILMQMEDEIGRVYESDPALIRAKKKYGEYMKTVWKAVEGSYKAFMDAEDKDTKEKARKAYMDEIRGLTVRSAKYKAIMNEVTSALTNANQKATDIVNDAMVDVYVLNYNQVAEECRRVGIKVK